MSGTVSNNPVAKKALERYDRMKAERRTWLPMWQLVSEYVFSRRATFTRAITPGVFLNGNVFDNTAPKYAHRMAAGMRGALFPSAKRAIKLMPPGMMPDEMKRKKTVRDYFQRANKVLHKTFDNPKSGWDLTNSKYLLDEVTFGVSGIMVVPTGDRHCPVHYIAVDTKKLTISEGPNGIVDTVFIEKEMTIRQAAMEYGPESLSNTWQRKLESNDQEKVFVLHAIEPRVVTKYSFGDIDMPVASIHIEIETQHIIHEGGFPTMPVKVGRYAQAMGEVYGRCPGIEVMPDVLELNATREMLIIAEEKMLDPPIAVTSESATGVKINTSARAINVRTLSGRIPDSSGKWIEPIFTVGDMKPAKERVAEIQADLKDSFYINLFEDLNNDSRQTLGEASIRDKKIGQVLGAMFARQQAEVYSPVCEETVDILFGEGLLGYYSDSPEVMQAQANGQDVFIIPDELRDFAKANDGEFYELEYISPASRIVRAEELMGMHQVAGFVEQVAPFSPSVFDVLNIDNMVYRVVELTGAPEDVANDLETVQRMRAVKTQAQQEEQQAQVQHIKAQAARAQAQAAEQAAKAGSLAQQAVNPLALTG